MARLTLAACVASIVAVLLAPLGIGSSGSVRARTLTAKNEIEAIAMDGRLLAYDVGPSVGARCSKVFVWDVKSGKRKRVSVGKTCGSKDVSELAVAGRRIAWIANRESNTESTDFLYKSSWRHPRQTRLATAYRTGPDTRTLAGKWIGGLVGSGSLLAVNRWHTDDMDAVTQAKLMRIGRGLRKIAVGRGTMLARSADSGRIAVARASGAVAVYSHSGNVLATVTPGPVRDLALSGKRLVVLTQANTLEVYGALTGTLLHTWPVEGRWTKAGHQGSEARLDASSGIAVYSSGHKVYAIRLSTGKNVLLVTAPRSLEAFGAAAPFLEIEAPGVAYAYDTFNKKSNTFHGHVAFIPMRKVTAAVSSS